MSLLWGARYGEDENVTSLYLLALSDLSLFWLCPATSSLPVIRPATGALPPVCSSCWVVVPASVVPGPACLYRLYPGLCSVDPCSGPCFDPCFYPYPADLCSGLYF